MLTIKGVHTALITPFSNDGQLDEEGLSQLIQRQVLAQVDGVVPLGTTGESPTLSLDERKRIITIARRETPATCTLMVGTGSYSTAQTIENTLLAEKLGADCALVVIPYYNKPTQEGLFQHFKALSSATDLPIVIYNPPHRTGQHLHTETFKRLLDFPSIVAIKEATGNISLMSEVIEAVREIRPDFSVLTGDDALTLSMIALGGKGVVSVVSNLVPQQICDLYKAAFSGNFELAREHHFRLMPLFRAAFIETNPIPIKAAMNICQLPAGPCRLPLCALSSENEAKLRSTLADFMQEVIPFPAVNSFNEI